MEISGEFYLHENGSVIYKPRMGSIDPDSPFVVRKWTASIVGDNPVNFTMWLSELHKLGARKEEIYRLADHNTLKKWSPLWEQSVFGDN